MSKITSKKCRKISFRPAKFKETTAEFINPDRGWYQIHTFEMSPGNKISLVDREYTLNPNDALAFLLIDIGAFRDRPLDQITLDNLREIFSFFRDYRLDMIVRVVYDTIGNCLETEPSSEEQIIEHINQLTPVMKEFADSIFVYQGLLIGNWGEMHSSKFLSPARLKKLSEGLLRDLRGTAYMAVRRPSYVRILFPEGEDIRQTQVGIFDDAILASPTHLGTFGEKPAIEVRREQSWLPNEEIRYVSALCDRVPYGGEALQCNIKDDLTNVRNSLKEMAKYFSNLHVSYLNRIHDQEFMEHLKNLSWNGGGLYRGMNGFQYMSRHLGYRFVLRDVKCKALDSEEGMLRWDISIENIGFARCFFDTGCKMEAMDEYGSVVELDISEWLELRFIAAGELHNFVVMTPVISGPVFLRFSKLSTRQAVYFANENEKYTEVGSAIYLGLISLGK